MLIHTTLKFTKTPKIRSQTFKFIIQYERYNLEKLHIHMEII